MKTKLLTTIGIFLLLSIGLNAAGLDQLNTSAKDFKTSMETLAKVIAALGLLFIVIRYFMDKSEQRSIPWGWVVGAIILGSVSEILALFGIS